MIILEKIIDTDDDSRVVRFSEMSEIEDTPRA